MDDEQGPWWTRPPEPGPQAPVVSRPQPGDDEEPDDGIVTPRAKSPEPWVPEQPPAAEPGPEQFETWGGGFATPPTGTNPWEKHPGLFAQPPTEEPPASGTTEAPDQPTVVQPATPEPPKKPKQVIRRVAVVDPNPPAPPPSNDRTETLPALGEDIFAVFDAQGRQGHGAAPVTQPAFDPYAADPLSHLRDEPSPHRVHLPKVQMPEPRFLLMAVGSGLVVLLVLLVVLLFGNNDPDKSTATPTPVGSSNTVAAAVAGAPPTGLKQLSDTQASQLLAKAGQGASGQIVEAWSWKDKNGQNLVVTTTEVTGANRQTLRVIHVADLDTTPRTLRVMKDPNLPQCKNRSAVGFAGFTKNSMVIRDLNDDGIAEVTAGWTSRCGGKGGTSEIKLALITDGKKYIVRDSGVVGKAGAGAADPRSSRWPDGFYPAVSKIWKKLYG